MQNLTINTNISPVNDTFDKRSPYHKNYKKRSPSTSESPISPTDILIRTCLLDTLLDDSSIKLDTVKTMTDNDLLRMICPTLNFKDDTIVHTVGVIMSILVKNYNFEGLKIILTSCKQKFIVSKLSEVVIENILLVMKNMYDLLSIIQNVYKLTYESGIIPIYYNSTSNTASTNVKNNNKLSLKECNNNLEICKYMILIQLNFLRTLSNYGNWADRYYINVQKCYDFAFLFDNPNMVLMIYKSLPCTRVQYPKLLEYTLYYGSYNCFKFFETSYFHLIANINYQSLIDDINKLSTEDYKKSNTKSNEIFRYHFAYVVRRQSLLDYLKAKLNIKYIDYNEITIMTETEVSKVRENWFSHKVF
jgi:hypothetical protein